MNEGSSASIILVSRAQGSSNQIENQHYQAPSTAAGLGGKIEKKVVLSKKKGKNVANDLMVLSTVSIEENWRIFRKRRQRATMRDRYIYIYISGGKKFA